MYLLYKLNLGNGNKTWDGKKRFVHFHERKCYLVTWISFGFANVWHGSTLLETSAGILPRNRPRPWTPFLGHVGRCRDLQVQSLNWECWIRKLVYKVQFVTLAFIHHATLQLSGPFINDVTYISMFYDPFLLLSLFGAPRL